jgi:hypothetical protein
MEGDVIGCFLSLPRLGVSKSAGALSFRGKAEGRDSVCSALEVSGMLAGTSSVLGLSILIRFSSEISMRIWERMAITYSHR